MVFFCITADFFSKDCEDLRWKIVIFSFKKGCLFFLIKEKILSIRASLVAQSVKNLLQCRRPGFNSWVRKIPWRRQRLPTPVFWPEESLRTEEPDRLQSKGSQESDMI